MRDDPPAASAVVLRGELDLATLAEVEAMLAEALDRGAGDLVVDVSAVSFVDSQTIGALMAARSRATESGRTLCLHGVGPRFARVLELYAPQPRFAVTAG